MRCWVWVCCLHWVHFSRIGWIFHAISSFSHVYFFHACYIKHQHTRHFFRLLLLLLPWNANCAYWIECYFIYADVCNMLCVRAPEEEIAPPKWYGLREKFVAKTVETQGQMENSRVISNAAGHKYENATVIMGKSVCNSLRLGGVSSAFFFCFAHRKFHAPKILNNETVPFQCHAEAGIFSFLQFFLYRRKGR